VTLQLVYTPDDLDKARASMREFGFGVLSNSIAPSVLRGLQDEVNALTGCAQLAAQSTDVSYRARIVPLGPQGKQLLFGEQVIDLLSLLSDQKLLPTETHCCVTYYVEGDHLGPHRDQPATECLVTFIAYVAASAPSVGSPNTGLALHVYGKEMTADRNPHLTIPTNVGDVVVGWGSKFLHERPKLEKGEYVTALTGCYRSASA
jgi:hypothetical protein